MSRWFLGALALVSTSAVAADLAPGESATFDLNARDANNGAALLLGPGDYRIEPVAGTYTAWNAWSRVAGCNAAGAGCTAGWITQFVFTASVDGQIVVSPLTIGGVRYIWSTPSLALANATGADVCLSAEQDARVWIGDYPYTDNSGGISASITRLNGLCAQFDEDGDGVHDDEDACPGFDDAIDADADGAPDACDVCPLDADDDADADGLCADEDACPYSPEGALTDDTGCAIADICPCEADWANHGQYVSCVAHAAQDFAAAGLIAQTEIGGIVSEAGRSSCGKPTPAKGRR